jgi:prevent-host-death family protein
MRTWQLQEAKNHLSEVVRNAINEGPQNITLHGKPAAVVVLRLRCKKIQKVMDPSFATQDDRGAPSCHIRQGRVLHCRSVRTVR